MRRTHCQLTVKRRRRNQLLTVLRIKTSPTIPTLRSQSEKKGGEIATSTTSALRKRKMDGDTGGTTSGKKSSLFVDAPKMREIRGGVKQAKEKQAMSVNKQRTKKSRQRE
jgi:hypothetical protein